MDNIRHDLELYKTNLTAHLRNAYEIVKAYLRKNAIQMKLGWDEKVKHHHVFKVDDKVLMYQAQVNIGKDEQKHSQVWKRQWIGPFIIVSERHNNNPDVYLIKDPDTNREWTVNVHKLRPYHGPQFLMDNQDTGTSPKAPLKSVVRLEGAIPTVEPVQDAELKPLMEGGIPTRKLTDATLEVMSKGILKPVKEKKHKSKTRHETGITVQETKRPLKQDAWNSRYQIESMDAFKEHEVDTIVDCRKRGNGYEYQVKWKQIDTLSWLGINNFNTTECIQDFWNPKPERDIPRQFKAACQSLQESKSN